MPVVDGTATCRPDRAVYLMTRDNILEGDTGASPAARVLGLGAAPPDNMRISVPADTAANFEAIVVADEGRLWKLVRTFDDPATWTEPGVRHLAASGADGDRYREQPLADEWELYDLMDDPIEAINRWETTPDDLRLRLTDRLAVERARHVPARNQPWPYATGERRGRFVSIADVSDGELADRVDAAIAACDFSGVIRVDRDGGVALERASGFADRRWSIPMTTTTRLSTASATKGFTALVVMSLVESKQLALDTPARTLLGRDLPLIDDGVTIEHLLGHTSGIGDYLDEEAQSDISDHVMRVPVHQLDSAEAYLAVLDGFAQVSPPGAQFVYNNGGYVVLALLAERAAGRSYHDLVDELVVQRAGLADTSFIRSDAMPANLATGYLDREGRRRRRARAGAARSCAGPRGRGNRSPDSQAWRRTG